MNEAKNYPIEPLSTFQEADRLRPKAKPPAEPEIPKVKRLTAGKYR